MWDIVDEKTLKNGKEFASMKLEMQVEVARNVVAVARGELKVDVDGRKWATTEKAGFADGIRCDVDGNIWASAGWVGAGYDGVHVFEPNEGVRIGQILLPEICSNVCFGGTKRNRLFMTGSTSLYAVYVETKGAHIT